MSLRRLLAVVFFLSLLGIGSSPVKAAPPALPTGFVRETFAQGLDSPTAFVFAGNKVLVANKHGTVQVVSSDGTVSPAPFLTLHVSNENERGITGIALHPKYPMRPYVYVYYTTGPGALNYSGSPANRLSRFKEMNGVGVEEEILLDNIPSSDKAIHNAGDLHFGFDGKLYVTVGDGGVHTNAPNLKSLSGKILRLNANGTIPRDNPFYGKKKSRHEIYALGFRNPFRMTLRASNQTYLVADVGETKWEELDVVRSGRNYGWPRFEGPCRYDTLCDPASTDFEGTTPPKWYYQHNLQPGAYNAIIGGAFAEHSNYPPPYADAYFFGDYAGWIHVLSMDARNNVTGHYEFDTLTSPTDFQMGADGNLYVASIWNGAIYRYLYSP